MMIKKLLESKKLQETRKRSLEKSVDQLREIAEYKMPDLNANDVEAAMRIVAGTAKNMGVEVEGFE